MKKVIAVLGFTLAGVFGGTVVTGKRLKKSIEQERKMAKKHLDLYLMMNQWVNLKQEGRSITPYFEKNGYKKIAIYCMNYVGNTLLNEFQKSDIQVAYGIDKRANELYSDIDIYSMEEPLEKVDVIVVTAISFFDEIREELEKKVDCPIVSLEEIIC